MTMLIVLLNWNNYPDTRGCLRSLLPQCAPGDDVLVLDNQSTDGSYEALRQEFGEQRVLFHRNGRNGGFAAGNNPGLQYAVDRGYEYALLLNNDTVLGEGALAALRACADARPEVGLMGVSLRDMDAPHGIQAYGGGWITPPGVARHVARLADLRRLTYVTGAAMLIRREVIRDIGGLDERFFMYWEDVDYSYRAVAAGWSLGVCPECVVYHRESASAGLRSRRQIAMKNAAAWTFARKHHGLLGIRFLAGMALRSAKAFVLRRRR